MLGKWSKFDIRWMKLTDKNLDSDPKCISRHKYTLMIYKYVYRYIYTLIY